MFFIAVAPWRGSEHRSWQCPDLVDELAHQLAVGRIVQFAAQDLLRGPHRELDDLELERLLGLLALARDLVGRALEPLRRLALRLGLDLGRHVLALGDRLLEALARLRLDAPEFLLVARLE